VFKRLRPRRIPVTEEEREVLLAAIDLYLFGMDDARTETIADGTVESAEQLLILAAGYDATQEALISMQRKLEHAG